MFVGLEVFGRRVPIDFFAGLQWLSRDNRCFNTMLWHFLAIPHHTQLRVSLATHEYSPITESAIIPSSESMPGLSGPPLFLDCIAVVLLGISWIMFPFTWKFRKWWNHFLTEQPKGSLKLRLSFSKRADYQTVFFAFPSFARCKRGRQRKFLMEDICCMWISSKAGYRFWIPVN